MKSVKNFFIERMNSIEQSTEQLGADGMAAAEVDDAQINIVNEKMSTKLHKLKLSNSLGSSDSGNGFCLETITEIAQLNAPPSSTLMCSYKPTNADEYTANLSSNSQVIVESNKLVAEQQKQQQVNTTFTSSGNDVIDKVNVAAVELSAKLEETKITGEKTAVGKRSPAHKSLPPLNLSKRAKEMQRQNSGALTAPILKAQKEHRKISLPWFRQSSVSKHFQLNRQHTIDAPGSFFSFRHPSSFFKVASQETTWVIADYISTPGTNELSVTKGQQVEIVEAPTTSDADFCLVRLNPQSDDAAVLEGLVPISILKPAPNSAALINNTNKNSTTQRTDSNDSTSEQANNRTKADPLISATKRRGFSGRKWLLPPLRKLSTSKNEKPPEKQLIKKTSEKHLRQLSTQKHTESEEGSGPHSNSNSTSQLTSANTSMGNVQHNNSSQLDYEADEEAGLELPPPMKPIQEPPHLIANGPTAFTNDMKDNSVNMTNSGNRDGNTSIDLSEIEQIVKEKTEQHEEKSKFLKPNFESSSSTMESNGRTADPGSSYNNYAINQHDENNAETLSVEAALRKRMCAISELLITEETYIQYLSDIVNGYIAEMRNKNSDIPLPDDLKGGKARMVFSNIEEIYEWHRDYFRKALQRCQNCPAEFAVIVKRYEYKFLMYVGFCQNKSMSEHIVAENSLYFDQIRQKLRHSLYLADLLIMPVQRLTKYELLLTEITKETERAGLITEVPNMKEAYIVMRDVCKTINKMMVLRSLQKFNGKLKQQGELLNYGSLTCVEDAKTADRNTCTMQKPRELQVFLFQQCIIFADIVGKKTQFSSPNYIYRAHIPANKMQLEELSNNSFLLKAKDAKRPELVNIICYAATTDLTREWLEKIRYVLKIQSDFIDAISSPIQYQKELTKDN